MSQSKKQLQSSRANLEARKKELLKLKADGVLTEEQQAELNDVTIKLVDIEEQLAEVEKPEAKEPSYEVPEQQKDLLHLKLVRGKRYDVNPDTGERINEPFVQTYTQSEWANFKMHFDRLGYTVLKVLHDPFGDATEFFASRAK